MRTSFPKEDKGVTGFRPDAARSPACSEARGEGDKLAKDLTNKNPTLVVFRLCFGTSSEHLGQAGCFRLPVKACRPQPPLGVPDSFNSRFESFSRSPRTGQGKFYLGLRKEHDCFCRSIRAILDYQVERGSKKSRRGTGHREVVRARDTGVVAEDAHPLRASVIASPRWGFRLRPDWLRSESTNLPLFARFSIW